MNYVGNNKLLCPKKISNVYVSPRQRAQRTFELLNEASGQHFSQERNRIVNTEEVREWVCLHFS